jgi:RNA polymerase sigma factor (sigma-70 family)
MNHRPLAVALGRLRRIAATSETDDQADRALLRRFAHYRDEIAFEALLRRHGPMVLGVCRRILGNFHAAEDAFQATFLLLVRKSRGLGVRGTLAGWLFTVARHAALRARADAQQRREREGQVPARVVQPEDPCVQELRPLLDEEISRLPDKFRSPLVLCYLEGLTNEEAARQLGCPTGTVLSRLARARARLRGRLTRRGLALSALTIAGLLPAAAAPAALSAALLADTVRAAIFPLGATAAPLVRGVLNIMLWNKIKILLAIFVTSGLIAAAGGLALSTRSAADEPRSAPSDAAERDAPAKEPDKDKEYFQDVTAESGINFTYRNGEEAGHYAILETLGGGVALIDYDGDGLLDIFITGGGYFDRTDKDYWPDKTKQPKGPRPRIRGYPCRLYKNLGGFKFKDVTKEAGLDGISFYTHGAAVADYDLDGWPDLLVTGYGRVALFHNVPDGKGGRRFVEVTEKVGLGGQNAGALANHFWATSAAWADLDGDGYPDLYICQYVNWSWGNHPFCPGFGVGVTRDVCSPKRFDARPHALYWNNGRGKFVDITAEAGIRFPGTPREPKEYDELKDYGKGTAVVIIDIDGDGRPDIFVANDTVENFLYVNQSKPGQLRFKEMGSAMGVARDDMGNPTGSMGVDTGDPFGIGRPSLWVTHYENEIHGLYRNDIAGGRSLFTFASRATGIQDLGLLNVGFGTAFIDLDNDGWEDLFIAHGHVIRHPGRSGLQQKPALLRNLGFGRFGIVTDRGGRYCRTVHRGRGVVIGDLDNDGRLDLVISHLNEPVVVLRNVVDSGNHWLGVHLGGKDQADVVGTRLTLEVGERKLTRFAKGGGSFLSSGDRRILFGLGKATKVGRLTVEWPSGSPRVQHFDNLAVDRYHRIVQAKE